MRLIYKKAKNITMSLSLIHSYQELPHILFSNIKPTPVKNPFIQIFNQKLANEIQLPFNQNWVHILSGNELPENCKPIAQAYSGHQFGHYNILGDGRAILLGEWRTPQNQLVDIQLKGAGPTPYSRRGDGRATLSAMLREYLISEALHGLDIPTSRSLAVVRTGEVVYREELHVGAILTRIASSHIRVGTFEYAVRKLSNEEYRKFLNYVIDRHYPTCKNSAIPALALLESVTEKQALLISQWMSVGFIHGVMNTDNMSIAGETIDYGPCAFMNTFHPATVFSSIDHQGRYAYANQPAIAQWNLAVLAGTLLPLIDSDQKIALEKAKAVIEKFPELYTSSWKRVIRNKLGWKKELATDEILMNELLAWMETEKADYTLTFLAIEDPEKIQQPYFQKDSWKIWLSAWEKRCEEEGSSAKEARKNMLLYNPKFIPRNHLVEEALEKASKQNDMSMFLELVYVLQNPFMTNEQHYSWMFPPEEGDTGYTTFCNT